MTLLSREYVSRRSGAHEESPSGPFPVSYGIKESLARATRGVIRPEYVVLKFRIHDEISESYASRDCETLNFA